MLRCHVDEHALKHTHTETNALVKQGELKRGGGGEGCIPVIDINGFKSPELTF